MDNCFKCGSDSPFVRGCRQSLKGRRLPLWDEEQWLIQKSLTNVTSTSEEEDKSNLRDVSNERVCCIVLWGAKNLSQLSYSESKKFKDPA